MYIIFLFTDSLLAITKELEDLASEWREVGLHLGITNAKIFEITVESAAKSYTLDYTKVCLIEAWLKVCAEPTWSKLADALDKAKAPLIASRIRQKYVTSNHDKKECQIRRSHNFSASIKVREAKSQVNSLKRRSLSCYNNVEQEMQEYCSETKHELKEQCASLEARLKRENDEVQNQIAKIEEMMQKISEERNVLLEQLNKSMCGLQQGNLQAVKPAKRIADTKRIEKLQGRLSEVKHEIEVLRSLSLKTGLAHGGDSDKLVEQLTIAVCHLDVDTLIFTDDNELKHDS